MPHDPSLRWAGECALTVDLGGRLDQATNDRVLALAEAITARAAPGLREVVPAYRTITVYIDPLQCDGDRLERDLRELWRGGIPPRLAVPRVMEIPVVYGGEEGPDLEDLARTAGLSPEAAAALHHSVTYRVYMLVFLPGFPYLGTTPEAIRLPRLAQPRRKVAAGSVAVAGEQCGIYPIESPGGWHLLGRTPLRLFEPDRREPCLLSPGDEVRFVPIDRDKFVQLSAHATD
jgi:KipI family sensor histidine kinase inhibitor